MFHLPTVYTPLPQRPQDWQQQYSINQPYHMFSPIHTVLPGTTNNTGTPDPRFLPNPVLLILTYNQPPIAIDLRLPINLSPQNQVFMNLLNPHVTKLLESATVSHSNRITITHPRLPWAIKLHQASPLTVQDVLVGVWNSLQQPVSQVDYFNLDMTTAYRFQNGPPQTGQELVCKAFRQRCRAIGEWYRDQTGMIESTQISMGIRRINWLGMENQLIWIGVIQTCTNNSVLLNSHHMQTSSELLKQASHLLRDVCRLVTSVDPPPANLTPHFCQEYIKDLQSLHRNSEMILTWTISLGQILNDSPGKPVNFVLGQYRDASWITPTNTPMPSSDGFQFDASSYDDVDDLTMDVIENIQSEEAKYSLQDLQRRIYHRSETITPQIELDSLRRIIFGYKKATTSDIHENTIYDSVSPGGLNHKLQRMTKPPPTFSNEQLLIDHEIFLWEAQATDKCRLWVHNIVHNIIAIDSVRLWGSLDEIEIFAYCEAVSKRLYASQFNAIATNESSTIKGGIKSQQQLVLQCIQNLSSVMARRSLLDKLYKKFGAIALLDSVILHPSSHGQSSPSSFLQRAVPSVIQALEHTPVERTEYWRRRKFVTRLLNMVAFPSTSEYVEDFFNRTVPPDIEEEEDSEKEEEEEDSEEEEEHEEDSEEEE
ncbi:hypothetical protein GG344DRAFT_83681 [Lentinula edodes]|nr:hypothetical protein GG344DRAFT_83681 [Lentinula edodes]